MPKPGIRMMTDLPRPKKRTGPIVRLEVGKAYTARKGSWLRVQFGLDAIYMVTQLPPVVTTASIVQVLSPRGVALCNAADLRPCDEFRLEDEE
jgi:hypothetical protein